MSAFSEPRALADIHGGTIIAVVEISAPQERVFKALTSAEVTQWWGDDQTYRTQSWDCELRMGGHWRAGGVSADGTPYSVGGNYLEIEVPHRLVQTWSPDWEPGEPTILTYNLEAVQMGTRLTIRHEGFTGRRRSCEAHMSGWELVLGWLHNYLVAGASRTDFGKQREASA